MKRLFGILSLFMIVFNYIITDITSASSIEELEGILNSALDEVIKDYESNDIVLGTAINSSREIARIKTSTLLPGQEFNIAIKSLTYGASSVKDDTYFHENKITKFIKYNGTTLPDNKIVISVSDAVYPVYSWFDNTNGTLYYYSEADKIYFNEDSSCMFRNFMSLNEINFHEFDLSRVTNMEAIFYGFGLKNLDLSFMDLSKVTNTYYMFQSNNQVENINFEGINMESLEYVGSNSMFNGMSSLLSVNLSGANFSNLKSISLMFSSCSKLKNINLSYSNFENVYSSNSMFNGDNLENLNLSHAKLGKISSIDLYGKNIDLSYAILSGITERPYIRENIENLNLEGTDLRNLSSMQYLFQSKDKLKSVNFSGTILNSLTDMSRMFQSNKSINYVDFSNTDLSSVITMEEMFSSAYGITGVNFSGCNLQNLTNTHYMFNSNINLESVNFNNANLSSLENVQYMFQGSNDQVSLRYIDFEKAKLGNNMIEMFEGIRQKNETVINFSGADFSNVKSMEKAFYWNPGILKIDFTNLIGANNITGMKYTFYDLEIMTGIDLSSFDFGKVTDMSYMFQNCYSLKEIDFGKGKIENIINMNSMFENCYSITGIDLSNFDLGKVTDMSSMFSNNNNLKNINFGENLIDKVQSTKSMFSKCYSLTGLDLSSFKTSNVTDMSYMFNSDGALSVVYVTDGYFNTDNVSNSENMFSMGMLLKRRNIYDKTLARIPDDENDGVFTSILDKPYNILYELNGGTFEKTSEKTYTTRLGANLITPIKTGYDFNGWYKSGEDSIFTFTNKTKGDIKLYAKWKKLAEKVNETTNDNVIYTNGTKVSIGEEILDQSMRESTINLVTKEVESENVKKEDEKITVQESEIQVTSGKIVEYQGGLEVYLEKTENDETTKIEGTAKFSEPVAVKIPITSNIQSVKIKVKHEGEEFGYKGLTLNSENSCVNGEAANDKYDGENVGVIDINGEKYALIYTCSASTFVAYSENSKPAVVSETISTPAAGGGRIISTTTSSNTKTAVEEHNSADVENKSVEQNTTTQAKEITIDSKLQQRSLTRGEVAVMTNILLNVYPQLVEGKQEIDDITNACTNYTDEQKFTKDEKKAITRLCKLSIMGIHADNNKPLDEFMVNQDATNDEFSKVINRSISTYNEKDLSVVKEALKKLEDNEENVEFGTVYNVFMSIKSLFN